GRWGAWGDEGEVGGRWCWRRSRDRGVFATRTRRRGRISPSRFADYDNSGANSDTNRHRLWSRDGRYGLDDVKRGTHRALGRVLVGTRPAEIDINAIAAILCDMPIVPLYDRAACLLVSLHHSSEILGIEPLGKLGRVDQVEEHDCDLATFSMSPHGCRFALYLLRWSVFWGRSR